MPSEEVDQDMQARRYTYAVYTNRMEEDKARIEKDGPQNVMEDHDIQNIPK